MRALTFYPLDDKVAEKSYDDWKFKTMSLITKRGWTSVFDDLKAEIPTKEVAMGATATAKDKELYRSNLEIIDLLVIACEGVPLGLVKRADGDAREAFKLLDAKYARNSEEDLAEVLAEFGRCKLASKEDDPDKFFLECDRLQNRLKTIGSHYVKPSFVLKAHYLANLPEEYSDVITKLSGKINKTTIEDLEKEIRNKWKRCFKPKNDEDNEEKEKEKKENKNLALNVEKGKGGFKKKFKGKCRNCGKQGHKAAECKSDKKRVCFTCGKEGHFSRECPDKSNGKDSKSDNKDLNPFVGMCYEVGKGGGEEFCGVVHQVGAVDVMKVEDKEKFLLDSGATCHVVVDETILRDVVSTKEYLVVGDGKEVQVHKKGTLMLATAGGTMKLSEVKVAPTFAKNIISTGALVKQGCKIEITSCAMKITDPSGKSVLTVPQSHYGLYYLKASVVKSNVHAVETKVKMDINAAHDMYGHASDIPLKSLMKQLGIELTGTKTTCEACAYAKAKAKAVCKSTAIKATAKGERFYVDTSGPYKKSLGQSCYWILLVDDFTRKAWSFFVTKKSMIGKVMTLFLDRLKGDPNVNVKYIRCDNAGENGKLKEICEVRGISMEFTAPHTPQMNGVVERKFTTIRDKALAMMLAAKLSDEYQGKLWPEAVHTATKLDNAVPNRNVESSPDYAWYGEHPKILKHLVQWGRIGYVTLRNKQPKLEKKSVKCVMVGYADSHSGDTYRVYKPDENIVILSRDVTWADWHGSSASIASELRMFAAGMEVDLKDDQIGEEVAIKPVLLEDVDAGAGRKVVEERAAEEVVEAAVEGPTEVLVPEATADNTPAPNQPKETRLTTKRLNREMARLDTSYNPTMSAQGEINAIDVSEGYFHYVLNTELASDPGAPKTYKEALVGPDADKWKEAMKKEIENFIKRDAWKMVPRKQMKERGRKPVTPKWIFKKKKEATGIRFKARTCARGFVQIPGVDFTLSHSPVASDMSVRMVLAVVLYMWKKMWVTEVIDVEAAFLEAKLREEVYLEWPFGLYEFGYITYEELVDYIILLERAMYGLVQSPREYFMLYCAELRKLGLIQSAADPCVWFKVVNGETVLIIVVYVDDCILAGPQEEINWFKKEIKKRFNITEMGPIQKHLGVWYERKSDEAGEFYEVRMDEYKDEIVKDWKELIGPLKAEKTPGYPGESLVKNEGNAVNKDQYRKFLGRLMWLVRKVAPECGNAVRELAMFMDSPGEEHWKAMKRLVGYLESTDVHLKLREPVDLKVYAWVDSNFATNKETRRSVTGYFVTIGGCLCGFSSKLQPAVTLSSTEAEYYAASTCATDIKFLQMLFEELFPKVKIRPATLFEDNTGAIFLMENQVVGNRMKHIDVRMHFIREMMAATEKEEARLVVKFIRSERNIADLETKNVTEKIHDLLVPVVREGLMTQLILAADREDVKDRGRG
jgi:hypothetical protein